MKNCLRFLSRAPSRGLLLLVTAISAQAGPVATPEPADFAIGFGGVALAFVVWRNFRKAK